MRTEIEALSEVPLAFNADKSSESAQLSDFTNSYHTDYGYGMGVRTLMDQVAGHANSSIGEFGWSGAEALGSL
ncbi:hypothetical protein ACFQ5D_05455 [Paenibacillus farraposensis]|uniref:Uncharacterized protein n=1 Tax=Paenibacillus farraposensis TaxID=2807095 RepID=A0ABW4DA78_9BACL|nr:hypothetical protein [Paenibacillus farraposensis]